MTTFWNLLRAEIAAHAITMRTFLSVAAIVVVANLVVGGGAPAALVCTMTAAFLPGNLFAQDEQSHLGTMYSILPVSRRQVVLARYLTIALVAAVMALVGLALAWADSAVRGAGNGPVVLSTAAVAGMGLAVVGAVVAVQLPLFFWLGYTRTGMYSLGAMLALMFTAVFVVRQVAGIRAALLQWAGDPVAGLVGTALAVVMLTVSAGCATSVYRRRSL